ncbi:MAG: hypothetical protein ACXVB1_02520 [Pseudobdellovibrionaceae bacterium]
MKFIAFYFSFISTIGTFAFAQSMGLQDIPTDKETTIRIQKGAEENKYEITTGTDVIEGEAAPLLKEARANWKAACTDWKKELKELNKENQVISLSCGTMKCSTTAMETTCTSEGKNKIRVKVK